MIKPNQSELTHSFETEMTWQISCLSKNHSFFKNPSFIFILPQTHSDTSLFAGQVTFGCSPPQSVAAFAESSKLTENARDTSRNNEDLQC